MKIVRCATLAVVAALLTVGAGPAYASSAPSGGTISPQSAYGCSWYPGSVGSAVCMSVQGTDLTVYKAAIGHENISDNVCNVYGQFKGTRTNGTLEYKTVGSAGCFPGVRSVTWNNPGIFKRGSQFCGRLKSSITDNTYGTWLCQTIG